MNKEKLTQFFKDYGFYLAVGAVSVGAIVGVFLMPTSEDIQDTLNPTTQKEHEMEDNLSEEDLLDENAQPNLGLSPESNFDELKELSEDEVEDLSQEEIVTKEEKAEEVISTNVIENNVDDTVEEPVISEPEIVEEPVTNEDVIEEPAVEEIDKPVNFESTTGEEQKYFSDGDTFEWPVDGEIIVPYKDNNTSHWLSEGLSQTMRTFGICIEAEIGENITPIAPGTIIDVTEDFTEIETLINVGDVGQVMIIDHGNGYKSFYGFQNGEANHRLIGQIVSTEDVIGIAGKGSGPFIAEESNIYLQVTHNDVAINPEELLLQSEFPHAVDMGHIPD
ncbi:hypothetical protein AN396_08040 [Candidatus Epulonipiscium fishelsonii]|uniref:Uncharacterized protein n=1 Tax=Candidatus Epulonipiscium fishelsonii TaxID=77094 RepID=A0ACC8XAB8_9FIRM|nr:hypothetical protein AN396_08040 [Epulopiscium sp. SCG-B11WGA-EpuloA1]